jgi:hypothetical protein
MLFTPVQPIQASAPTGGLLRAATIPSDGARWQDGMAWRPERCPTAASFDPCDTAIAEIETVTITGDPTGGTFTLTYTGQTTAAIAYNATANAVQVALEALNNLNHGDVRVTGTAGGPYTVTFRGSLGNITQMTASAAGLTGGTAPAVVVATTQQGAQAYGTVLGVGGAEVVYYLPPAFRVQEDCRTSTGDTGMEDRVRRQAAAVSSYMVARELWTGERTQLNPYTNPEGVATQTNAWLASPDATLIAGAFEPYDGLGELEETARRAALGLDVFIHVPIEVVPLIANAVEKVGNLLKTETGAIIVADAGYLGTNQAGADVANRRFIYATGPVEVRLGDIATDELVDHRLNIRTATAERVFAATFDPCVHYGLAIVTPATS